MKHPRRFLTGFLSVVIAFVTCVQAGNDVFVSLSGSNSHPYSNWATAARSIQDAVNAASSSDRVVIGDGIYNITSTITVTNGITVESLNGSASVRVDAGGTCRVFDVSHVGAIIRGLTISGGNTGVDEGGGGIRLTAPAFVESCTVSNNNAYGGGGIYCEAGGVVTNCLISHNNASGLSSHNIFGGGGIKVNGPAHISMCEISHNTSYLHGAGAQLSMQNFGESGLMELCNIHHNYTEYYSGGGAHVGWLCTLRNSLVHHNQADKGGGLYATSGSTVENCTVTDNIAESYGYGDAGGIYIEYAELLRNTICWNNTAAGSYPDIKYSPDAGYISYLCCAEGVGSNAVTQSPEFNDPANFDYSLTGGSSCINAGTNNNAWMSATMDLAGNARITDGTVDIGAYEYTPKELAGQFSAGPMSGTVPLTVQFTTYVQGTNLTGLVYRWDFNGDAIWDLTGSDHDAPQHTYTLPGSYTVAFEVSNSAAESSYQVHSNLITVIPDTIYLSPSGSQEYPYDSWATAATDFGAAVAAAGDGTSILVANGTYVTSAQLNISKAILIESLNGAESAKVRPTSLWHHRAFNITHADAVVSGLTIYNAGSGSGTADGGGVFLTGGSLLRDCIVSNCMSWTGGGVCIETSGCMTDCLVTQCDAAYGGGIYLKWGGIVSNCVVRYNDAYWSNPQVGSGGGIELNYGSVVNTLVYGNRALDAGSGIRARGTAMVMNSTIVDNGPFFSGDPGGIWSSATLLLQNSIIWSNATDSVIIDSGDSTIIYCCSDETITGTGNRVDDPLFASTSKGPYRLGAGSPCIDTGSASDAPDRDLDGIPRPLDGNSDFSAIYDIGASEYAPPSQDSDDDTLPDYDEVYLYGTNPRLRDSDSDGMDDNDELVAGSNPAFSGDVFAITSAGAGPSGIGFIISWNSHDGRLYTLRSALELSGPWGDIAGFVDVPATGTVMSWTNSVPAEKEFFILRVQLAE